MYDRSIKIMDHEISDPKEGEGNFLPKVMKNWTKLHFIFLPKFEACEQKRKKEGLQ